MENKAFNDLLLRYLADEISPAEFRELLKYLQLGHQDELRSAIDKALREKQFAHLAKKDRADVIFNNILLAAEKNTGKGEPNPKANNLPHKSFFVTLPRLAAAAVVTIVLGTGIYFLVNRPGKILTVQQASQTKISPAAFTRYIVLPDSSTVIVQANSELEYPADFSPTTREVTLTGEAYFNIRHDASKPFIIHTGKVKTTVLGTAFNVKAIPGTGLVTVSVVRGKVRVEEEKKLLAVLSPNQQVVYSSITDSAMQKAVNTKKIVTDWTTQDMIFKSVSMVSVAKTLSRRYGINVIIKNAVLQQCIVQISFSGTESLKDVVESLCTLTNASIVEQNNEQLVIDGEGCQ